MTETAGPRPTLAGLTVAADPEAWRALGFTVATDGTIVLGTVRVRLTGTADTGDAAGLTGWTLALAGRDATETLDGGLATTWVPAVAPPAATAHPNGAHRLDHVVVMTPDLDRTLTALRSAGLDLRRVREAGRGFRQGFFRLADDVIVEVGGDVPDVPATDPARFWGLVAVVPDVDALAEELGPGLVGSPKDAVQPGRRILTVRREAAAGLPLAFLTPHVRKSANTPD